MTLFYAAYFDASGRPERHTFLRVAGAVAPINKGERFDRQWWAILESEGVKEFHATDFAAGQGEFIGWEKPRRSRFIRNLATVLKDNTNKLFSSGWKSPRGSV